MTTVLVARHGETTWNRDGRVQGWAPSRLTERGRREADALGRWLDAAYDVDWVVASDLRRTRETAAGVGTALDPLPDPVFEPGVRERCFGAYQGLAATDLFEMYPDHDRADSVSAVDATPPDGESIAAFRDRVLTAWDRLCAVAEPDETVLVVTHGGVIKLLLAELTGRDPAAALAAHSQDNCAVNEITVLGDGCTLRRRAVTDWRDRRD